MHKFLLLLTLSVVTIGQNKAQNKSCQYILEGEVRDSLSNKLLSDVRISFIETPNFILSDQNGSFHIEALCPGMYTIRLENNGYTPFTRMIRINQKKTKIQFRMVSSNIELEEVAILGKQSQSKSIATRSLTAQQIEEGKGKTLSQQLTAIAGVTMLSTGTTIQKPVINGLHSQRVLILNHGLRQEGQQWGAEHAPEIDPFTAGHLEVSKGAQAVRYGADALAGVILLTPSQIDTNKKISTQVDLVGNSNGRGYTGNIALEGKQFIISKLAWRLQASTKKQGTNKSASYYIGNTGVEEANFSGLFQYPLTNGKLEAYVSRFSTKMGIFTGAHVGSKEDILVRIANGKPFEEYEFSYDIEAPRQAVTHTLAKVKYDHRFANSSELLLQYGFQENHRQEFDVRRVQSDDTPMADLSLKTQSLDAIYSFQNYKIGVQGTLQINNNVPGTGTTPIIPNFDNHTFGTFAIAEFQRKKHSFELGIRYDYRYFDVAGYRYNYQNPDSNGIVKQYLLSDQRHFHNVSGTAGISYAISDKLLWKSNASLAWRAPSANELYSDGLHHGSGTYEIGNPNLKSEKGLKYVNHFAYQTTDLQLHTDVYAQYIADYIYVNPNPDSTRQTIRGTFPVFNFQQDQALFYGFDVQAKYQFLSKKLAYEVQLSVVRAKNLTLNNYLPNIPSDRLTQILQWNFNDLRSIKSSYLKLSHQFVARQNRYEPLSDYATPPAAYHLLAFYTGTSLLINQHQLAIQLAVENLTNNLYKDYMDRFRYYTHQQGRNISLRLSYNF